MSSMLRVVLVLVMVSLVSSHAFGDELASSAIEQARAHYASGDWERSSETYAAAYEAAEEESHLKAEAALEWASLLWEQGEYGPAQVRVKDALERAKKLKMDSAIGRLLLTLGHIEASQGRLREAENTLSICVKMAGEQRDVTFQALCRLNVRMVRTLQGKSAGSEAQFEADVAALKAGGAPLSLGASLSKTAELYQQNGDHGRAMQFLVQAGEQFKLAGSVPAQARNRMRIAALLQEQGRHDEARGHLTGLIDQFAAMKNRPLLVNVLGLAARDAEVRGDTKSAVGHLERALKVAGQTKSPQLIAKGHLSLCELEGGYPAQEAIGHCGRSAKLFEQANIPALMARARAAEARLQQAANNFAAAQTLYLEVIEIMEKRVEKSSRDATSLATQYANLCQVELNLQSTGAHKRCLDALKAVEKAPQADAGRQDSMITLTHYAIGVSAANNKNVKAAMDHLQKAAELAEGLAPPNLALATDALLRLGAMQAGIKRERPSAAESFQKGIALASAPALLANRLQLRTQLAQMRLADEQWDVAAAELKLVIEDGAKAGDAASQAWAYSGLGRALLKLGKRDEAVAALKAGLPLAKKSGDAEMIELFEDNLKRMAP
ncbi:MAG: hypothetical protein H0U74_19230 [Bradymonadaceae bacterium]|nr:hypothetical protein [Lujinxingiaceae bacterium]